MTAAPSRPVREARQPLSNASANYPEEEQEVDVVHLRIEVVSERRAEDGEAFDSEPLARSHARALARALSGSAAVIPPPCHSGGASRSSVVQTPRPVAGASTLVCIREDHDLVMEDEYLMSYRNPATLRVWTGGEYRRPWCRPQLSGDSTMVRMAESTALTKRSPQP